MTKTPEHQKIEEIVSKVVLEYRDLSGCNLRVQRLRAGAYFLSFTPGLDGDLPKLPDHSLTLDNLPDGIWQGYVRCVAYEMMGRYLREKWPISYKPSEF